MKAEFHFVDRCIGLNVNELAELCPEKRRKDDGNEGKRLTGEFGAAFCHCNH
jgi:hypothetical protein